MLICDFWNPEITRFNDGVGPKNGTATPALQPRGCHSLWAPRKLPSVVDARKCGGVRRNFSGRISSYSSWEPKCTWTILLERGYRIVLTIPFLRSVLSWVFFADGVVLWEGVPLCPFPFPLHHPAHTSRHILTPAHSCWWPCMAPCPLHRADPPCMAFRSLQGTPISPPF